MNEISDFEIRRETDIARLVKWRAEVIANVFGHVSGPQFNQLIEANTEYLRKHLADATHVSLMASAGGEDIGSGDLCIYDEMPSPDNPTGVCAYLMNIYVRKPFRNKGVASAIVARLIAEATRRGAGKIYLETTDEGRDLYKKTGFKPMKGYMKL